MARLREGGRIEIADIYAYTRDKFNQFPENSEKKYNIIDEIRERIKILEESQHKEFVDINSGAVSQVRDRDLQNVPGIPEGTLLPLRKS